MKNALFPKACHVEGMKYQLVLWRKIPDRAACAIYVSPLVYNRGKLERSFILLDLKVQTLSKQATFALAWQDLIQFQYRPLRFAKAAA